MNNYHVKIMKDRRDPIRGCIENMLLKWREKKDLEIADQSTKSGIVKDAQMHN